MNGRLLGIDYGTVRVGLAISDRDRNIASPLTTLTRRGEAADGAFFRDLIAREQVVGIVVGLPVHLSGREGVKAGEARKFGEWLATLSRLSIAYADERFTTVHAEDALWNAGLTHRKRKQKRDCVAAQIMLQAYLDAECPTDVEIRALDA